MMRNQSVITGRRGYKMGLGAKVMVYYIAKGLVENVQGVTKPSFNAHNLGFCHAKGLGGTTSFHPLNSRT